VTTHLHFLYVRKLQIFAPDSQSLSFANSSKKRVMLKRAVTNIKERQTTACKHYLLHIFTQQTAGQGPTINVRQWNITVQC
jgi:hypothetical protein